MVSANILSVRNVLKILNKNIKFDGVTYTRVKKDYMDIYEFRLLIILKVIREIFNNDIRIIYSLENINEEKVNNKFVQYKSDFFSLLLPFLTYEDHRWDIKDELTGDLVLEDYQVQWKLSKVSNMPRNRSMYYETEFMIFKNGNSLSTHEVNFFFFLRKTIEIINKYDLNWYK